MTGREPPSWRRLLRPPVLIFLALAAAGAVAQMLTRQDRTGAELYTLLCSPLLLFVIGTAGRKAFRPGPCEPRFGLFGRLIPVAAVNFIVCVTLFPLLVYGSLALQWWPGLIRRPAVLPAYLAVLVIGVTAGLLRISLGPLKPGRRDREPHAW